MAKRKGAGRGAQVFSLVVESIATLRLRPGDILVVKLRPGTVPEAAKSSARALLAILKEQRLDDVRVLYGEAGTELQVLRPEDANPSAGT